MVGLTTWLRLARRALADAVSVSVEIVPGYGHHPLCGGCGVLMRSEESGPCVAEDVAEAR